MKRMDKEKYKEKYEIISLFVLLAIGVPLYILTEQDAISSLLLIFMILELAALLPMSRLKSKTRITVLLTLVVLLFITIAIEKYSLITNNGNLHDAIRLAKSKRSKTTFLQVLLLDY